MAEYPESLFPEISDPKKRAFLAAYAHTGRITYAAKAAQTNWRSHYNWLYADPVYANAVLVAKRMAGDFLEEEAIRRALEGVTRRVFFRDELIDERQEYSDVLLIFLLKGAKPDTYREHVDLRVTQEAATTIIAGELGITPEALQIEAARVLTLVDAQKKKA